MLEILADVRREVAVVRCRRVQRFPHAFTHIFAGGYAAGYYSYSGPRCSRPMRSARFEEAGLFDRDTADRFRRAILAVGGSRNALDAFVEFRGRPPELDALLRPVRHRRPLRPRSEGRDVERQ